MSNQYLSVPKFRAISDKRISLDLARVRVKRWLNFMRDLLGPTIPDSKIPRAIYISIDDINQLISAYPEVELKGIRVYFGLAGEDHIEPAKVTDLRGLLVPVLYASAVRPQADYIMTNSPNPNDTAIYDFTAPCPQFCDFSSELYVAMPERCC
ncbi:hypothetical protein [Mucilaginibacter paludis]|uniref:Uncharacterized protein n=1 Tax=Mucilaginibacter paludis DSM 18603 TaxID=714943 RepID=H1Y6B6_9SPHI|nr:hypothetical protein [Mucilaginibacter paludis]EHQ24864.1 hypothetical protein Mucpa_0681 [Mucilaginibacter paludis DSM 18603]